MRKPKQPVKKPRPDEPRTKTVPPEKLRDVQGGVLERDDQLL